MKRSTLFLTGLSLVAAATTLAAQNTPAGARRGGPPNGTRQSPPAGRPHFALVLDANGDRVISFDELEAAPAILKKLDANQDGQITRDELRQAGRRAFANRQRAGNPRRAPQPEAAAAPRVAPLARRPVAPVLAALDTDRNGVLSAGEIAAAPQSLRTLDTNADQQLSLDEIRPADRGRGFRGPRQGASGDDAAGPGRGRGPQGPRRQTAPQATGAEALM